MASIQVVVKHQGNKYEVDVDAGSSGETFKYQLFSLTGVEPDRQKIIVKGKQLKDDTDMSTLGLKAGAQLIMMGTPGTDGPALVRPKVAVKFVEDMTAAEAARQGGALPAGLENLGNTCYLNSTLQTLRSIPELGDALATYVPPPASSAPAPAQLDLVVQLRDLYKDMAQTQDGLPPLAFLSALRQLHPQFAERSRTGHGYAQQDAEEAWSQILAQLKVRLRIADATPKPDDGSSDTAMAGTADGQQQQQQQQQQLVSFVDRYMAVQFATTTECDDPAAKDAGEEPTRSVETLYKLNCHIEMTTNHLRDGILAALSEKLDKRSPALDRDASYTKTSKISRLPKYLTVHFVRFFWRRDVQKKAKIMRKVTFPRELDVVEFCTDDLKKALVPVRDKVREVRKDEEDIERAQKRRKKNTAAAAVAAAAEAAAGAGAGGSGSGSGGGSAPATGTATTASTATPDANKKKKPANPADTDADMLEYKTDAQVEEEKQASLLAAKRELFALVNQDLLRDTGANQSGLYELRGVVTHRGISADSGHYTAYVKKTAAVDPATGAPGDEDGNWWWFNDDRVSEVAPDKIDTLSGGGESDSALILLYKAIPLPTTAEGGGGGNSATTSAATAEK